MAKPRIFHVRSGAVLLLSAIFILGIPSIPPRKYHLLYWACAFVVEVVAIIVLWPFGRN